MLKRPILIIYLVVFSLQGCLLPPSAKEASIIEGRELEIVTYIQKGKEYALSGRLDAAERLQREANILDPNNPIILNDLGFTLHSQFRYREALDFYMRALKIDGSLVESRQNLARVFFDMGDYEQAQLRYQDLINYYVNLEATTKKSQTAKIMELNRAMAQVYYKKVEIDDALCSSAHSFLDGPAASPDQFAQHIRMLMSLNMTKEASKLLQSAISLFPAGMPEYLLQDYGILLYYMKEYDLSGEAFSRILAQVQEAEVRRIALLFKYLLALKNNQVEEATFIFESLLEVDRSLCKDGNFDFYGYWPYGLEQEVAEIVKVGCENAS